MKKYKAVFLDLDSINNHDLDLTALKSAADEWDIYSLTSPEEVRQRVTGVDIIVSNKCPLDRDTLTGVDGLKLVVVAATGTNNVDHEACTQLGVPICNVRNYGTAAVVQHVIAMMLNLLTGIPEYLQRVRAGEWSRAPFFCLFDRPIRQMAGMTLGVIGYGTLGQAVAETARSMGMEILVAEHKGCAPRPGRASFEDVISQSDIVTLHCPLDVGTESLIDRSVMTSMKDDALLINAARGGVVNEQDLADCLREGVIAGAAVDTLSVEPPPVDHVLLASDIPNLMVTPHNAWASRESRQALIDQVAEVITEFKAGRLLNRC